MAAVSYSFKTVPDPDVLNQNRSPIVLSVGKLLGFESIEAIGNNELETVLILNGEYDFMVCNWQLNETTGEITTLYDAGETTTSNNDNIYFQTMLSPYIGGLDQ
jgi:hypothetical protein